MLIDINNMIKLSNYAKCKGCTQRSIKKAIIMKKLKSVTIDKTTFIILDSKSYLFKPKKQIYNIKPLPDYKEPFLIDTNNLISIKNYAIINNYSYKEIFVNVVYKQLIPHVRIDDRIFIVVNQNVIESCY